MEATSPRGLLLRLFPCLIIRYLGPMPSILHGRALPQFPWVKTLSARQAMSN